MEKRTKCVVVIMLGRKEYAEGLFSQGEGGTGCAEVLEKCFVVPLFLDERCDNGLIDDVWIL